MHLPAWLASGSNIVNLLAWALIGLAVLANVRKGAFEELKEVSQARGERIAVLEADHERYVKDAAAKHERYERQIDELMVRIEALAGTVANLERKEADAALRNLDLQRRLDDKEKQLAEAVKPRRPHKAQS